MMGHHILLAYLKQHPETGEAALMNAYVYFKFKAYLQTTLRCTRKAYCIKALNARVLFLPPEDLCALADENRADHADRSPLDVEWAIGQLEAPQAEVIRLYFYGGKTDLEIARSKNVSRQAVNNLRRRALHKLKSLLAAYED